MRGLRPLVGNLIQSCWPLGGSKVIAGKKIVALLLGLILLLGSAHAETNHIRMNQGASVRQGIAAQLTRAFMSVAAGNAEDTYCLWVSGNLDVRVTDPNTGEYLSSQPGERKSGNSFGYLGEKTL